MLHIIAIGVILHVCLAMDLLNFNVYHVNQVISYTDPHVIHIVAQVQLIWLTMITEYVSLANGVVKFVIIRTTVLFAQVVFICMKDGVT